MGTEDSWLPQKQFVTTHPGNLNQCSHHRRLYLVPSVVHFQWYEKNFYFVPCHFHQLSLSYRFFDFRCHQTVTVYGRERHDDDLYSENILYKHLSLSPNVQLCTNTENTDPYFSNFFSALEHQSPHGTLLCYGFLCKMYSWFSQCSQW